MGKIKHGLKVPPTRPCEQVIERLPGQPPKRCGVPTNKRSVYGSSTIEAESAQHYSKGAP